MAAKPAQGADWLLADLNYILDTLIGEGDYDGADRIACIIEDAERQSSADALCPGHWQEAGTTDDWYRRGGDAA